MKKLILIALVLGTVISCEDFEGWNVDTKNPSDVPPAFLVTHAEKLLFDQMCGVDVNTNNFNMMAQMWGQTTYQDEANYLFRERDVGGGWSTNMYRNVLADLQEASRLIDEKSLESAVIQKNQLAMIEMLSIFTWHVLVDTYGYIPYSEALHGNANLVPVYDTDESVYMDLFNRLDTALNSLDVGADIGTVGSGDLIYGGDIESWMKFGNTLKLRMAVRIADFNHAMATTKAAAAILGGVFDSNADNAAFPYESAPPNTNPDWVSLVQSGRKDYIPTEAMVNLIAPLNDPRITVYFDDNVMPYVGAVYGLNSAYVDFTHIGEPWHTADTEGIIMDYAESRFLIAEAIERGLVPGDAETFYNAGVAASIVYWGGSAVDAATYLGQASVAYGSAGSSWQEVIGNQKYLALYGRGWEAWNSWKLLDYPDTFTRPVESELPVPRRYYYGTSDPLLNGSNYDAASSAIGGDELESRVFWDIVGVGN